ncbi:MAG: ferrous iron transport protein A [Deltaproteobacteria bacterium]|nr:MAG: ferrous iron transport protein A [Deltaproteobacteria bacterium]
MTKNPTATTLDALPPGRTALVLDIVGDDRLSRRLSDLGFWSGTRIEVMRRAPFGDPTQYRLQGYRIALRRNEAQRVVVEELR